MPLPAFDTRGDLPVGVHPATLTEVLDRFGHGPPQRELVTTSLLRVYELAKQTGKLLRFVIFGSYVTAKPEPNDVDIILVMTDDLRSVPVMSKPSRCLTTCGRSRCLEPASFLFAPPPRLECRSISSSRIGRLNATRVSTASSK